MPISEWVKAIRDVIGHDMVVMVGAAAIVIDDAGNVLLQQRTDNGLWGVPGGGVEPGEEPAQAAVRETYEETGLQVEVTRLVGVFGGKSQVKSYPNGDRFAYVSVTFECRVIGGEIIPDPEESADVRWFAPDALPTEFTKVHHRRLSAWRNQQTPFFEYSSGYSPSPIRTDYIGDIRQKIGNQLLMMSGCNAVVFNDAGDVLVQKRTDTGEWNLPGGLYEIGEEPAETAIRETYEETGLLVRPTRLVGVYGGEEFLYTYADGNQFAFIAIVFACEIIGGELNTHNPESAELRFVKPDELPDPFMDKHRQFVDHAINRTEPYFVS